MNRNQKYLLAIILAVLATIPGVVLRLLGMANTMLHDASQAPIVAIMAGVAILGASFLLLWACDALQEVLSQTLVLAIVALIAVLPEYAVDMYFTWMAGKDPAYAHYAVANMTGANRLLIGVAWSVIAVIYWFKTRRPIVLHAERRTEIFFLGLATIYAFFIPIKGSLAWYDGLVFIGMYVWYIIVAGRRPVVESDAEGPAELLLHLPAQSRRIATFSMILFSALVILVNAEPFSEGLIGSGRALHIPEFLLVQWLAPIASEAPEFTVAIMFALRGQAGLALGSLLSSKLNQWTLLVGMIPGVFAVSHQSLEHPIPMGTFQMHEIMLTAAQSLLAVIILMTLRLSIGQGLLLFGLFMGQFVAPYLVHAISPPPPSFVGVAHMAEWRDYLESLVHPLFSVVYVITAVGFLLDNPDRIRNIWHGARLDVHHADVHTVDEELEMNSKP